MDSKEFFRFLSLATKKQMIDFYSKTKDRIRKSVCAGWYYARYSKPIEFEQESLFKH